MFDIFLKSPKKPLEKERKVLENLIEEIHETFYTEVDKLLEYANIKKSCETDKQLLLDKAKRLEKIGFVNTLEVKEAEIENDRLHRIRKENYDKEQLIEAIKYFSDKYPWYKFITESSIKKICAKYGLIYGNINRYKGTVPDKNLEHIENFKIHKEDKCYLKVVKRYLSEDNQYFIDYEEYIENVVPRGFSRTDFYETIDNYTYLKYEEHPLVIACPIKDYNMKDMEVHDFKVKPIEHDPIVFQPVFFKNNVYYLIVTAWGLEASDKLVVNAKMN